MKSFLVSDKPLHARDWAVDASVAVIAFLFGVAQMMLEASSIIIPDLALRQYLGLVNVVPSSTAYLALAVSMDARCYGAPDVVRTSLDDRRMSAASWGALVGGVAACLVLCLL